MNKRLSLLITVLLAILVFLTSCGTNDDAGTNEVDGKLSSSLDMGGFSHNQAASAGFGIGSDTLEDISSRFGEPDDVVTNKRHASTDIEASYSFGHFIFIGEGDETPVLTQVNIGSSEIVGPCSLSCGMSIAAAASSISEGSDALIEEAGYKDVYLYQFDTGYYAKFILLTAEYRPTDSTDVSKIVCSAPSYDEGIYTIMELYFNGAGDMTSIVLSRA